MAFVPSVYQQKIFDFVEFGGGSAVIEAVAGSGKTSTICKAVELIPENQSVLVLAFSKDIQLELEKRMPKRVEVRTFNGFGHSILGNKIGRLRLDNGKMRAIVKGLMGAFDYAEYGKATLELIGYARSCGLLPKGINGRAIMEDVPESWTWLIDHFAITLEREYRQFAIDYARQAIKIGIDMAAEKKVIDYADQVYIPSMKVMPCDQYDWVIVDEAQDVSSIRIRLIGMAVKRRTGRLLAVGDTKQAIFGFTGSDSSSMGTLRRVFDAQSLPLSISYRCAKNIVVAAQEVMPTIEASPFAIDGEVLALDTWTGDELRPGDMVLCRMNAPVISLAWKLVGDGIRCRILGRDVAAGIVRLIEDFKPRGLRGAHGLGEKLASWEASEVEKWEREDKEDMVAQVRDRAACIRAIMARSTVNTVPDLIRSIEAMFTDDAKSADVVTLCSMHKSKGLEADRVYVLDIDLLPMKHAKQAWQLEQEMNLKYVALTRAKKSLFFVRSDNFKEGGKK